MQDFLHALFLLSRPWLEVAAQLAVVLLGALLIHRISFGILARIGQSGTLARTLIRDIRAPVRLMLILFLVQVVLRDAPDALPGIAAARHLNSLALIVALTWLGMRCVTGIANATVSSNPLDVENNLKARKIQTQVKVLSHTTTGLIILVGASAGLMTLPSVRHIGETLLASAGVAGLVLGFAAKPVLGNMLAGLQIALTQPIRIDDVVIVEGEWGWIEEITGTYVVVRLWDQRRLVVPLQWFIEHPFQNWTRNSADIIGTVLIWTDYRMPMESLRAEAQRLCETSAEWDGRVCNVQVTEASERAIQVRVLVSAGDSPRCWDLRCRVREGLIDYVQREYPACLPLIRGDLAPSAGVAGEADRGVRA